MGHLDCLRLLLLHGAPVDVIAWGHRTALTAAVQQGQLGCLRLLLVHGANIWHQAEDWGGSDNESINALQFAKIHNHGDCESLLSIRTAIDIKSDEPVYRMSLLDRAEGLNSALFKVEIEKLLIHPEESIYPNITPEMQELLLEDLGSTNAYDAAQYAELVANFKDSSRVLEVEEPQVKTTLVCKSICKL